MKTFSHVILMLIFSTVIFFGHTVFAKAGEYSYFTGSDPYAGVDTFVGDIYKDKDPDSKWLDTTKKRLDSMGKEEYLALEEHNKIIDGLTRVEYKHDLRRDIYNGFKYTRGSVIEEGTAYELHMSLLALGSSDVPNPKQQVKIVKVIPMWSYINEILEWYYSSFRFNLRKEFNIEDFRELLKKVFLFTNSDRKYDDLFTKREKKYLNEIFYDGEMYLRRYRGDMYDTLKRYKDKSGNCNINPAEQTSDYFSMDGITARFVPDIKKNEVMMEIINAKQGQGSDNKNRCQNGEFTDINVSSFLLMDSNCSVYTVEPGAFESFSDLMLFLSM